MKLIGSHASPYTRKVRIVAAEKRIDYEFVLDNPWSAQSIVPAKNPIGKVPVLVLDDGGALYDSRVIVEYLDGISPVGKLIPATNRERIEVRRWEALADGVLDAGILVRLENQRPVEQRSPAWIDRQLGKVKAGLDEMESSLHDGGWCNGAGYSLADIAVGACLAWLDFRHAALAWRTDRPKLEKLAARLADRPSFIDTAPKE